MVLCHWALLEADFARYYQLDLAEAVYGPEPISFRRLDVLTCGLPLESRIARELGAPKPGEWDTVDELLAANVEILGDFRNLFVLANRDPKQPRPKLPEVRVPRPGDDRRQDRDRPATGEELARFLKGRGLVRYTPKTNGSG